MHCTQVIELLSEYVDDALDPTSRAGLEEHLAHCRTCAAELASLRSYLEAMASLPRVQAPEDFLAGVHERLEEPSWFKRLLSRLFLPLKVKLPFEAAGLVAASLLVVMLYRGMEPQKAQLAPDSPAPSLQAPATHPVPTPIAPASPAPAPSTPTPSHPSAEKSLGGSRPPSASRLAVEEPKKDEAPPPSPASSSPSLQAVPAEAPMKSAPAPLQERAEPPQPSPLRPHVQAPAPLQERSKSLTRESFPAKPQARFSDASVRPVQLVLHLKPPAELSLAKESPSKEQPPTEASPAATVGRAQEQAPARKAASAPMPAADKVEQTAPASPTATISQLKELVKQAKGSVLSVDHDQPPQSPRVVTVQVPARNYSAFLQELHRLGKLEEPAAAPSIPNDDALIQLHIRLVPPS